MAAPLKLEDTKLRTALLAKIRKGERLRDACESSGIDYSSFRRWLREGEPPENIEEDPLEQPRPVGRGPAADKAKREYDTLALKRQFYHDVEKANSEYRVKLDGKLRSKADSSFRDLLTYARIRFPDDYREPSAAPTVQVNTGPVSGDVTMTFAEIAAKALDDEADGDDAADD